MTISEESLQRFIALCEEAYGRRLTPEEARPAAVRLVELYRLLTRPAPAAPQAPALAGREAA